MKVSYFAIGDIIRIEIIDKMDYISRLFDSFYKHYENFKIEENVDKPDLSIEIGEFEPDLSDCYEVGNGGFFCREDWFYIPKEEFKGARWRFEVEGLNSTPMKAKISCNVLGRIFITGAVIDSLIHLKLLEKNHPLIHASAVSMEDCGYVLSSVSGGGKTTTATNMANQGFNFLGDNFVMLHGGRILSFPTSLSIFTYNLTPLISDILTPMEKLKLEIKKLIYQVSKEKVKFFTKINPRRVMGDIVPSANFRFGFFLIPYVYEREDSWIEECTRSDYINKIVNNHRLEFSQLSRYLEEYSYFYPENRLSSHWDTYRSSLLNNLPRDAEYYTIYLPRKPNQDISGMIRKIASQER